VVEGTEGILAEGTEGILAEDPAANEAEGSAAGGKWLRLPVLVLADEIVVPLINCN
jgi:hypothetical protein